MFKNLFGLKKQPDKIKIAEEESQMTQDFEQTSLEDFKILETPSSYFLSKVAVNPILALKFNDKNFKLFSVP